MNPHDKWYFERPELMVSGQVTPPKLDLANEDLVKSHLHAIWLAETGVHLGRSIKEILDLTNTDDNLPITELKRYQLADPAARERALIRCRHVLLQSEAELNASRWYGNTWLDNTLNGVMKSFDEAFDRWRTLYRSARKQQKTQNNIMEGATASPDEYKQAERLRREAEAQIKLLQADERGQNGDFEPYRYLASAGFLPGYNFPRLPLNAYLPGRAGRGGTSDDFVARSRFIAISEFGPQNIVYHEGHQYQINRVIIPPSDGEEDSATLHGKLCPACGYGHMWAVEGTDRCVNCNTLLAGDHSFNNLFRMQNVSTRRISRITSDEEERRRFGYELRTAYRFGDTGNGLDVTNATYSRDGETLATAAYGPSTTIWRINLGWSRRKDKHTYGFMLDFEKGYWEQHTRDADSPEDLARHRRIIPFVEDRRNALVFELQGEAKTEFNDHLLSLQYALRRGIEAEYQVEQNEIGVELLPSDDAPDAILFYEAAEGGAGVLSQIATDHNALNRVAQQALLACHFNEDGDDDMANTASDHRCEAACYSCLLSYSNQRYHEELNRHEIRDLLLALAGVTGQAGTGPRSRSEQLDFLLGRSTSDLEKAFVEFLHDNGHVLPDDAQRTIEGLYVRPDFLYTERNVCVFVDGPLHEFPEQRAKDDDVDDRLTDAGYTVIRVTYPQNWPAEIAPFGWVFDKGYKA
jgi:hypothetical protein